MKTAEIDEINTAEKYLLLLIDSYCALQKDTSTNYDTIQREDIFAQTIGAGNRKEHNTTRDEVTQEGTKTNMDEYRI